MNSFREFLLGRSEFKSPNEIIAIASTTDDIPAEALLIFQTSRQQTWLVATKRDLICVLDDLNKGFTRVQWRIPKESILTEGAVKIEMRTRSKTEKTGLLDIGERRNWLYSKRLYSNDELLAKLKRMIVRNMA